eukprot:NODE_230_length_13723_cov_0.393570.p3 type:complete len:524 gc:universal NODE_230_length_13723_cov_0.393570:9891-11462(+)
MKRDLFFSSHELLKLIKNVKDVVLYSFYLRENALNGLECGKSYKEASGLLAQAAGVFLYLESSELEDKATFASIKEISLLEASELYFLQAKKDAKFSNSLIAKMCVSVSDGYTKITKSYIDLPLGVKSAILAKKYYYESMANFYAGEAEESERLKSARFCLAFQLSEKSIRIFKKLNYPGLLYKAEAWKALLHSKVPSPGKLLMIWNNVPQLQAFDGPIVCCVEFSMENFLLPVDLPEFLQIYLSKTKPRLKSIERIMEKAPLLSTKSASKDQCEIADGLIGTLSDAIINCRKAMWEIESDFSAYIMGSRDISNTLKDMSDLLDSHEKEFKKITKSYSNEAVSNSKSLIKPIFDSSKQLDIPSSASYSILKYEIDSVLALQSRIDGIKSQLELSNEKFKLEAVKSLKDAKKGSFIQTVWHSISRKSKSRNMRRVNDQVSQMQDYEVSAISNAIKVNNIELNKVLETRNKTKKSDRNQHSRFLTQQHSNNSIKIPRLRSRTNDRVLQWLHAEQSEAEFEYPVLY